MSLFHERFRKIFKVPFLVGLVAGVVITTGVGAAVKGSLLFTDVPSDAFYDQAVGNLYSAGIIRGYDATHLNKK